MDLPPGTGVTSDSPVSQAGMLRRAWFDVAATVAPQLADLPLLLEARLADLEATGRLDEASLLAVAEDASQHAMEHGAGDIARTLSKRLRRSIYEFLLALDAVHPAELANAPAVTPLPSPFSPAPTADASRPAVSIARADVSGADDAATAHVAPVVPLWEQMARPEKAREVYRAGSRDVVPADAVADVEQPAAAEDGPVAGMLAADAAEIAELAAQMAEPEADPVAEMADFLWITPDGAELAITEPEVAAEAGATDAATAEATEPEAIAFAVTEPEVAAPEAVAADAAAADRVAPEASQPEAVEAQACAPEVDGAAPDVAAPDATASAVVEPEAAASDGVDPEAVTAEVSEADAAAPEASAPDAAASAPAQSELVESDAAMLAAAAPEVAATDEPVADHTATEPAGTTHAVPNGGRPHRDLLRVPRQFRRLPPLIGHRDHHDAPAAELAGAGTPVLPEAPVEDDDALGVPALPWPLDAGSPRAEAPAPPVAFTQPAPDEELGVPFAPLAGPHAAFAALDAQPAAPTPAGPAEMPEAAPAESPAAPTESLAAPTAQAAPPAAHVEPAAPQPAPAAAANPWPSAPTAPAPTPFPIAPVEGFHLTDPGALDMALAATPDARPAAPPDNPFTTAVPPVNGPPQLSTAPPRAAAPAPAPAEHHAHEDEGGTWRVRQSPRAQLLAERMAQKRREEAARAAFEAASVHDQHSGRKRRRGEEPITDLASARRQLDEHLRRKRGAEAAALLQRLAQELGGRDIADVALDAGDRCRALGQSRSATNCYLAAWRADPLYETPLWRLSDVCLNDQEIELAVGYLERVADLMRSRGDDEGAIGVYRKIAMIAPERQDVRDVIRLAKTTGRLDV